MEQTEEDGQARRTEARAPHTSGHLFVTRLREGRHGIWAFPEPPLSRGRFISQS